MPPAAACWRRKQWQQYEVATAPATRRIASRSRAFSRKRSRCNRRRWKSPSPKARMRSRAPPSPARREAMTDLVKVSDQDGVRTIRMNRADKKNALNVEMYTALASAVAYANLHREIRCLLIAGV